MTDPVKDPKVEDPKITPPPEGDPGKGDGEEFVLPENLKGKTPEELAKMVVEKETHIGKLGTDIGELRTEKDKFKDDLNYAKGVEEIRRHQEQKKLDEEAALKQPPKPDTPKWDYEDPVKTVDERIDTRVRQEREEGFKARVTENIGTARSAFAEGQKIMDSDKELYEGIEEETRQGVFQYYAPYIQQGQDVSTQMRDPKSWRVCAQNIRLARGEIDKLKAEPAPGIVPVSPIDQGVPGSPSGQTGPMSEIDPEIRSIQNQYGLDKLTDEELREIIQEEAKLQGVT